MNLANILTMSRFGMTVIFAYCALMTGQGYAWGALFFFTLACVTDALDGYVARHYQQISAFGALMDPIADKFLTLTAFFIFAYQGFFPFWIVALIAFREISITIVRLWAQNQGQSLPAEQSGKVKTVVQMVSLFGVLVYKILWAFYSDTDFLISWDNLLRKGLFYLIIVALFLTLYSGVSFFVSYAKKGCPFKTKRQ